MVACLVLAGCLEFEQTVTLRADGSGTQAVRMTLRDRVLREIAQAAPAARIGGRLEPDAVFNQALVEKELTGIGLELTEHRVERTGDRRTVELTAGFADFTTLQHSPLCGSAAQWVIARGPRAGTAKLTLYPQGKAAWLEARQRARTLADRDDPLVTAFFDKRRAQLAGLQVVMRFRLPGDVLVWTANMDKTGEREVTARLTAAQIKTPQDLVRRLAPRFEVIFDASGCSLPLAR